MPLEAFSQGYETRQGRSTVGIRCTDHKPWSLYVPITINNFKQVVILKQAATRNKILTEADISLVKMNIKPFFIWLFQRFKSGKRQNIDSKPI